MTGLDTAPKLLGYLEDYSRLLFRNRYGDVAQPHTACVVALDVERSGFAFVGVNGSSGNALNFLSVNCGHAVV